MLGHAAALPETWFLPPLMIDRMRETEALPRPHTRGSHKLRVMYIVVGEKYLCAIMQAAEHNIPSRCIRLFL